MKGGVAVASTISSTTITAYNVAVDNPEYSSFATNFYNYFPTVMEVVVKYTGSSNVVAGRMYGIAMSNLNVDLSKFPLDPNGCEALTSEGLSCTWYGTSPVWNNPILATGSVPTEWGSTNITVGLIGGPASATNIVTVGVYLHLAAMPMNGICGLTPLASLPDPVAVQAAGLMSSSLHGIGQSAMSLSQRDKVRRRKALIRDVLKVGGQVVGTVFPSMYAAANAAEALSLMLG